MRQFAAWERRPFEAGLYGERRTAKDTRAERWRLKDDKKKQRKNCRGAALLLCCAWVLLGA